MLVRSRKLWLPLRNCLCTGSDAAFLPGLLPAAKIRESRLQAHAESIGNLRGCAHIRCNSLATPTVIASLPIQSVVSLDGLASHKRPLSAIGCDAHELLHHCRTVAVGACHCRYHLCHPFVYGDRHPALGACRCQHTEKLFTYTTVADYSCTCRYTFFSSFFLFFFLSLFIEQRLDLANDTTSNIRTDHQQMGHDPSSNAAAAWQQLPCMYVHNMCNIPDNPVRHLQYVPPPSRFHLQVLTTVRPSTPASKSVCDGQVHTAFVLSLFLSRLVQLPTLMRIASHLPPSLGVGGYWAGYWTVYSLIHPSSILQRMDNTCTLIIMSHACLNKDQRWAVAAGSPGT